MKSTMKSESNRKVGRARTSAKKGFGSALKTPKAKKIGKGIGAAVAVAGGYLLWKNRESIRSAVKNARGKSESFGKPLGKSMMGSKSSSSETSSDFAH